MGSVYRIAQSAIQVTGASVTSNTTALHVDIGHVNVKEHGAVGDGVTDDTAAIVRAFAAANASTKRMLHFPPGVYLTDKITACTIGMRVTGSGQYQTTIKSRLGDTVFEVTGISPDHLTFEGFTIKGNGGSGHGIYIHDNLSSAARFIFRDLKIDSCGGKGLYFLNNFTTLVESVMVSGCGDNAIEMNGGNTCTLINCYVNVVAAGKVGYRIYGGSPVFIACNGVAPHGGDWGLFGRDVANDGAVSYCYPRIIGCNCEDFGSVGMWFRSGSTCWLSGTSFTAPTTGTGLVATYFDYPGTTGSFIDTTSFTTKGATWANGQPIHTNGGRAPFHSVGDIGSSQYYNQSDSKTYDAPVLNCARIDATKQALNLNRLGVTEQIGIGTYLTAMGYLQAGSGAPSVTPPLSGTAIYLRTDSPNQGLYLFANGSWTQVTVP